MNKKQHCKHSTVFHDKKANGRAQQPSPAENSLYNLMLL